MAVKVFVVEDHPIMRDSLLQYLRLIAGFEVCGVAATAEEALSRLDECEPSVVLLDLSLPHRSGLDLLRDIKERWDVPCVILSGHGERSYVGRAFAAGARGYVLKGRPDEVPTAVLCALDGKTYLSDGLRDALDAEPDIAPVAGAGA
jgi:DNA-binding NarL/FixJ family response regulator